VLSDLEKMLVRLVGADVRIDTEIQDGLWAVQIDLGQLEQVITNLVVNARDASAQGGVVRVSTRNESVTGRSARRDEMPPGDYVILRVADSGEGMDAPTRDRIFEPFFTTKDVGEGTGLGLATCYGIAKQAGGFIWVDSEPGEGAVFEVYLPRADAAPLGDSVEEESGPEEDQRGGHGTETVLLVDDEESVRRLTEKALTRFGYRVLSFPSGQEAVIAAEEADEPIHLLLTDIMMPGMGGREVADRVQVLLPAIRILYTSGYSPDRFFAPKDLGHHQAFLQKPFVPSSLTASVRELLDRSEA